MVEWTSDCLNETDEWVTSAQMSQPDWQQSEQLTLWSETQTCRTQEKQIIQVSRRCSERQSKQERHREATPQTDRETQKRGAREQIKEEWWRAYLQAATWGITVIVSVTPLLCHPSFSLYLSLSSLSQHKHAFHRGVHLLTAALQRRILFVYQCVCMCVTSEGVQRRLCCSCLCVSDGMNEEIHIQLKKKILYMGVRLGCRHSCGSSFSDFQNFSYISSWALFSRVWSQVGRTSKTTVE